MPDTVQVDLEFFKGTYTLLQAPGSPQGSPTSSPLRLPRRDVCVLYERDTKLPWCEQTLEGWQALDEDLARQLNAAMAVGEDRVQTADCEVDLVAMELRRGETTSPIFPEGKVYLRGEGRQWTLTWDRDGEQCPFAAALNPSRSPAKISKWVLCLAEPLFLEPE